MELETSFFPGFQDFLTNRTFSVKFKDSCSALRIAVSGVPQGSILGQILFLMDGSDLANNLDNRCKMYGGGDVKIYGSLVDPDSDCRVLQEDLDKLCLGSTS